jgi:glycosyltransferase involved in cell wall biosynthesis
MTLAVVGVEAAGDRNRLGRWERIPGFSDRIHFLPAASAGPPEGRRRIPRSVRLAAGLVRRLRILPRSAVVQAHRADVAVLLLALFRRPLVYFVHTQSRGLTHDRSDSFWRRAAAIHRIMEQTVCRHATDVVVFNEDFVSEIRRWTRAARFSPTWWDPAYVGSSATRRPCAVLWAGRMEIPKDPLLALDAFSELCSSHHDRGWTLDMAGAGSMSDEVQRRIAALPPLVRSRITFHGMLPRAVLADRMARSDVLLMTSHPGYEGYPRVLVEALASGLSAVVTEGSDTGGLVADGVNGMTTGRDPVSIAEAIRKATALDPAASTTSVSHLSAPTVVRDILGRVGP